MIVLGAESPVDLELDLKELQERELAVVAEETRAIVSVNGQKHVKIFTYKNN